MTSQVTAVFIAENSVGLMKFTHGTLTWPPVE